MDSSTNSDECDALYKTERLDELERGLYEQVREILLTIQKDLEAKLSIDIF